MARKSQSYENFDLELFRDEQPSSNGPLQTIPRYKVRLLPRESGGDYNPENLSPLPNVDEQSIFLEQLRYHRIQAAVNKEKAEEIRFAVDMGSKLFGSLFHKFEGAFKVVKENATNSHMGIRLRLFMKSPDLQNLPWEYLCEYDENKGESFFLIHQRWLLVRYLGQEQSPPRPASARSLRVLLLIGGDEASSAWSIDWKAESEKLSSVFREAGQSVEIVTPGPIDPETLLDWLVDQESFQVVHFIGHGFFDEAKETGYLRFYHNSKHTDIDGQHLLILLSAQRNLQLIVLNACFGSRSNERNPFSSIAAKLTESNVPAVVAMQFDLLDRTAIYFSRHLYYSLARGLPVEEALAEARRAMFLHCSRAEFGIPVLYTRIRASVPLLTRKKAPSPVPTYELVERNLEEELKALLEEVKMLVNCFHSRLNQAQIFGEEKRAEFRSIYEDLQKIQEKLENTLRDRGFSMPILEEPNSNPIPFDTLLDSINIDFYNIDPAIFLLKPDRLIQEGRQFLDVGKPERAIQFFMRALSQSQEDPVIHYWLGKAFNYQREFEYAIPKLEKALCDWNMWMKDPSYIDACKELAYSYQRLRRDEDAMKILSIALELKQKDYHASASRGWLYVQQHNFQNAIVDFTNALESSEDDADLWFGRALCYDRLSPPMEKEAHDNYEHYLSLTSRAESSEKRDTAFKRLESLRRLLNAQQALK